MFNLSFARYSIFALVGLLITACSTNLPEEVAEAMLVIPEVIDYNVHIKPILSDRCYKCHGPDANQQKANFRLDLEESAFTKTSGEKSLSNYNLVAGKYSASEMFQRIISDDVDYMMPPPESNLQVSALEKAMIAKWIEDGAEFKEHWSFMSPIKAAVPKVDNEEWTNGELDHFILAELQRNKIKPAVKADKSALLRRLSLDITGLPPSVEDLEAFLNDADDKSYEKKVDELLNQPQYGERMASIWLDAARYADTHGYQDDGLRNVWPWREWVIQAFNDNMPYDQFITEQLAGDLLPNPSPSQILATCFNRNHPQTQEGGVVDEEYRVEYVADRTNTYGKAILGLTMECARCHDHKYDPISQKDYYSLSAFFNNNNDSGIVPYNGEAAPTVMLPTPRENFLIDSLGSRIRVLEGEIVSDKYVAALTEWLSENNIDLKKSPGLAADFDFDEELGVDKKTLNLDGDKPAGWGGIGKKGNTVSYLNKVINRPDAALFGDSDSKPKLVEGKNGMGIQFMGDCGVRFNRNMDYDRHQPFSVSIWIKLLKEGEKGPIFNNSNGDFEGYRGWLCKLNEDGTLNFQLNHVWPDNAIDYQTTEKVEVDKWTHISMSYDGSSLASGFRFYVNGKRPESILHKDNLHKSLLHGKNGSNWSSYPLIIGKEKERSIQNLVVDNFKVYNRELSEIEVHHLAELEGKTKLTPDQQLEFYLLSGKDSTYNRNLRAITDLRDQQNLIETDVQEVMVMHEKKVKRQTYILDRGMYDSPMGEVHSSSPDKFGDFIHEGEASRLDLAKWTTSPENPLTSRVHVNRLWTVIFGRGIVATQEDFGNQGSLPTHNELLDFLAVDFVENGWDTKRLLKKIFMSSTYQQSSIADESTMRVDPANKLYSRYPKHRLSAEIIRDHALASSGLLSDSLGGPSVYPYQPAGIWKALATRNATVYAQGQGEDLYRRSLYTIWKRTAPPPSMLNFDAPDRYICTVDRQKTATPLQSLILMNDPQYLEACKVIAADVADQSSGDINEEIDYIFKALVSRGASETELELTRAFYESELKVYEQDPASTEALLSIGEFEIKNAEDLPKIAALTMVASSLMNYDEFIMKR